jgi:hypothetical protein
MEVRVVDEVHDGNEDVSVVQLLALPIASAWEGTGDSAYGTLKENAITTNNLRFMGM